MDKNVTLKYLRSKKGLNLKAVADKMGISVGYLSHLETGRRRFSPAMIEKLSDALHEPLPKIQRFAEELDGNNALVNTWIASIRINGQPLVKAFRYHLLSKNESVEAIDKSAFARKLASFVAHNIELSLLTELAEKKGLASQLMKASIHTSNNLE